MQPVIGLPARLSMACPVAGDSACSIPPQTIPQQCLDVIRDWTPKIARELKVIGLINIQYAIQDNQVCRAPQAESGTELVLLAYLAFERTGKRQAILLCTDSTKTSPSTLQALLSSDHANMRPLCKA